MSHTINCTCFDLPGTSGLCAKPAARRGMRIRDDKPICQIGRHEPISGLWLKRPFDIHAQITLHTDRFKHWYYMDFIYIYAYRCGKLNINWFIAIWSLQDSIIIKWYTNMCVYSSYWACTIAWQSVNVFIDCIWSIYTFCLVFKYFRGT